jgi:copper oxidase (laccase) domain-containing protein
MCQNCYEVYKDFVNNFKEYPKAFKEVGDKLYFNLKYIINQKLISENINPNNIEFSNECSYCLKDKYFSYRRDQYGCPNDDVKAMVGVFGIKE